jgi:hypothetical protein
MCMRGTEDKINLRSVNQVLPIISITVDGIMQVVAGVLENMRSAFVSEVRDGLTGSAR